MPLAVIGVVAAVASVAAAGASVYGATRPGPKVPGFTPINTAEEQRTALAANMQNFPQIQEMTAKANTANQEELTRMLRAQIPGFDALVAGQTKNLLAGSRGELAPDVTDQVMRSAAAKGFSLGTRGQFNRNLVARDLGMTSQGIVERNLTSTLQWLVGARQNFLPQQVDVTKMFVGVDQQLAAAKSNQENKMSLEWMQNQIDYAKEQKTIAAIGSAAGALGNAATSIGNMNFGTATPKTSPGASSYDSSMFPSGYPSGFFPSTIGNQTSPNMTWNSPPSTSWNMTKG